jgi:Fe2+ transport system protein B
MSWNEIFQIISGVIISVGGAGVIIWKLSSYLGEIWAKKHLESIKKEYQKEIEDYKSHLDMLKETTLRYSGRQFELYNQLWLSLCNLKSMAGALWEEANEQNLGRFSQQLKKTMDEVEKSYLFIEENHYQELSELLNEFKNYKIGKKRLVQLYMRRSSNQQVNRSEIQQLVEQNREGKQRYEQLVKEIGDNLKKQIRGGNN